jgi:hypothetical protein
MAYQTLDLGTSADDGTGDSLRVGGDKINDNFSELYTLLGNGSILTTGLSVSGATITLSEAVGTFTTLTPPSPDGASLGTAALEFSDLYLYDSSVIYFGADSDITLTHVPDVGLRLKSVATADDKPIVLTLQTGETDIAASDVLGKIEFQAPDEGTGTDAILVAAHIAAISEGDFSASSNATKLSFATGSSETATEKMSLSSAGLLTIADDLVIKTGGTIGGANDTDLLTLTSAVLTVAGEVVGTGFTGTLDGILGSGTPAAASVTTVTATGDITMTSKSVNEAVHTEAAHATTSDIWTGGNTCLLSGSAVTFTDVADAPQAGAIRFVVANAAHVITDNSALEVDGNASYTCAAGDVLMFTAKTTSTFRVNVIAHGDSTGAVGDALTSNPLSQFAATTSAQLAGVISNESGSGLLVFNNSPALITPALGTPSALVGTNISGTAASLTSGNVTTNANLTGHITS